MYPRLEIFIRALTSQIPSQFSALWERFTPLFFFFGEEGGGGALPNLSHIDRLYF